MDCVLYNYKTGQYLKLNRNNRAELTAVEAKAKRFDLQAAKNYRTQNLAYAIWGVDANDFDILLANTGKMLQPAPNRNLKGEETYAMEQGRVMTKAEAYEKVRLIREKLPELAEALTDLATVRRVIEMEQAKADGAIQDIQHKAEFDDLGAAEGYKLYKLLQGKRQERRRAKDALNILSCIPNELSGNANLASQRIKETEATVQARSYTPRELPELFKE